MKQRIAYYLSTPRLGGAETHLRDLLWGLDREQFDVTLFYDPWPELESYLGLRECPGLEARPVPAAGSSGASPVAPRGWKHWARRLYRRSPLHPWLGREADRLLREACWRPNLERLEAALAATRVDVLHVINGGYPGAAGAQAAAVAARHAGIRRRFMTVCSTAFARRRPQRLEARRDREVAASLDAVVVPAEAPGRALVEQREFQPGKLRKIPFGIRAPRVRPVEESLRVRLQWQLPPGAPVIGAISGFYAGKGQPTLIDALAVLRRRIPQIRAVLIGEGPERARIERRAAEAGIADTVVFAGRYPDVFEALGAFDIFVCPSELEGLPYSLLEAMSQAQPVVATAVGGIPEAVLEGVTGFLVPPRDSSALSARLLELIESPDLRRQMGAAGLARFEAGYTVDGMLRAHEQLYREAAA